MTIMRLNMGLCSGCFGKGLVSCFGGQRKCRMCAGSGQIVHATIPQDHLETVIVCNADEMSYAEPLAQSVEQKAVSESDILLIIEKYEILHKILLDDSERDQIVRGCIDGCLPYQAIYDLVDECIIVKKDRIKNPPKPPKKKKHAKPGRPRIVDDIDPVILHAMTEAV